MARFKIDRLSFRLCEAEPASCHHPATNSPSNSRQHYDTESASDSYCVSSTDSHYCEYIESATDSSFYEIPGPWTNDTFSAMIMRKSQSADTNIRNAAASGFGQVSPDVSEYYDTPITQTLNATNNYYNLQKWLIPDPPLHITCPSPTSSRQVQKKPYTQLSIEHHRPVRGSPWVCYYPPTPPIRHNDPVYQTIIIPAPPASPAPSPPGSGGGNKNRKRVHFSGTDEIFITQSEMREDVSDRIVKLVVYSVAPLFLCLRLSSYFVRSSFRRPLSLCVRFG